MSQKDEPRRPLPYERPGSAPTLISRGQFRWLLILLTVHLLITIQNTYAPGLRVAVKEWRADRQQKAARAAAVKQALALEQQAMRFTEPATKVVWEEDPEAAAKLVAGAGYRWIKDDSARSSSLSRLGPFPRGAMSLPPPILTQSVAFRNRRPPFDADEAAVVFLHGLKSPGGKERLVLVYVAGQLTVAAPGLFTHEAGSTPDKAWTRALQKEVQIVAMPCVPGGGEGPAEALFNRATWLYVDQLARDSAASWTHTPAADGERGQVKLEQRVQLRLFAGQPDPADPSRFTIAYNVNGQAGTIHGRLKDDDTIQLRPSTGKTVGDRWYPGENDL